MSTLNLLDSHSKDALNWLYPPANWSLGSAGVTLFPDTKTDYWQRTHYGFQNDNGHFYYTQVDGDFILTTKVHFAPKNQYDQAGLMVRFSPDFWIKTSIEYEPDEPNRLGAVVTRYGYSDWSTQDISKQVLEYQLQIRREDHDYIVEFRQTDRDPWTQIRMAHLENPEGLPIQCGLYACSPIEAGFKAQFKSLKLKTQI